MQQGPRPAARPQAPPPPAAAHACRSLLSLSLCPQQEYRLTIVDLAVGTRGNEVARQPAMKRLASFQHSGRVAALEVRRWAVGGGWLVMRLQHIVR